MNNSHSFAAAFAVIAVFLPITLCAREIFIANPTELKEMDSALPGDVVILKNGTWTDAPLKITKGGSAELPLVVRAETPGSVVFKGTSKLDIYAPYVTVDGLHIQKGGEVAATMIAFHSINGIVRNTAITDDNAPTLKIKDHYVVFAGSNNLLDHCLFKGKSTFDSVIKNANPNRHNSVTGCYFKDIPYIDRHGKQIFQIFGYSQKGDDGAFFTIEGNLFDHADGEGRELISLKSNRNRVIRNTIIATRGDIDMRYGNSNTIQDNIILGKGCAGARGIRVAGENHVVQGNFISGCESGIMVECGDSFEKDLTGKYIVDIGQPTGDLGRVPYYEWVKNLTLRDNIVVGSTGADLDFGGRYKVDWPKLQCILLPESCLVQNNRFVRPNGGISVAGTVPDADRDPVLPKMTYLPNKFAGNVIVGGTNGFEPSKAGFVVEPIPLGWSEAKEAAKLKPLTAADVGPDWARSKGL